MSVSVQPKYADNEILQGVKQLNCRSIAKTTLCYHLWILVSNFCLNSLLPPQVPRLGQVLNKTITTTIILMAISHVDQPSTSLPLSSTCQVPHYPSLSNCSNKGIFIVDNVRWLSCHQTNSAVNPLKPMKTTDRCNSCFFQQCQRTEGNSKHDHNQEKSPSGSHPSWTINWLQTEKIRTLYTVTCRHCVVAASHIRCCDRLLVLVCAQPTQLQRTVLPVLWPWSTGLLTSR